MERAAALFNKHGIEFLMDNRHLWLRSNRQWAIMRVRATIVKAMRAGADEFLTLPLDATALPIELTVNGRRRAVSDA